MNCKSWEGLNEYMGTHYVALGKIVEAQRKFGKHSHP